MEEGGPYATFNPGMKIRKTTSHPTPIHDLTPKFQFIFSCHQLLCALLNQIRDIFFRNSVLTSYISQVCHKLHPTHPNWFCHSNRSRWDSDLNANWEVEIGFLAAENLFILFSKRPEQPSFQWVMGSLSQEIGRPGHEIMLFSLEIRD